MSSISRSERPGGLRTDIVVYLARLHTENADQQVVLLTWHTDLDVMDILIGRGFVVESEEKLPRGTTSYELSPKGKQLAKQCHSWCEARDRGKVF